jgi:hypothetical protein
MTDIRAIVVIVALGISMLAGWQVRSWKAEADDKKRVEKVHKVYVDRVVKGDAVAVATEKVITKIEYRTRTVLKEVPKYVTAETDKSFPLSNGFVRLHDYAVTGGDPIAPSDSDGAASDTPASEAIGTIVENYATCDVDRERLRGLQDWVRQIVPIG